MEVHRPRAVHGWRELFGEVGVIVLGVVIALSGEQAVEALHWTHQVDTGEVVLNDAFAREVRNAALREAQDACVTKRLASLLLIVRQASESGRLAPVAAIGHPAYTPWTIGAWDALEASQTVSHMPREKVIAYTAIDQLAVYLSGLSDREEDQWTTLDSMVGPGRRLSDVEAEELRTTLAKASNSNRHMRATSGRLRDAVKATGLVDTAVFADAVRLATDATANAAICRPMAAPSLAPPTRLTHAR
jgi:hypothetical protein